MSDSRLIKIGGFCAIAAGVFIILARVFQVALYGDLPLSIHAADRLFVPLVGIPGLIGSIFFLLGITGLYAYEAHAAGKFGMITFLLAFICMSLSLGANWTYAFGSPYLASTNAVILDTDFGDLAWGIFGTGFLYSYLLGALGYLAFCVATIFARVLPRWIGFFMLLSMILAGVLPVGTVGWPSIALNILMGSGPIVFGYHLIKVREGNPRRTANGE